MYELQQKERESLMSEKAKRYWKRGREEFDFATSDVLIRRASSQEEIDKGAEQKCLIVLPIEFQIMVLHHSHDRMCHRGISSTMENVLKRFDWPGLVSDVARYVNSCLDCQRSKKSPGKKIETSFKKHIIWRMQ